MMERTEEQWLRDAVESCYFLDMGDAAARLSRANTPYGLAKIHAIQRALGMEPDATFVSTPDATVTRNMGRWTSGVGYGGVYTWSGDFFPVELKPNVCGVAMMGLHDPPDMDHARDRVDELAGTTMTVDGIEARWDVDHGNHFINVYQVSDPTITSGYEFVVMMHASGRELRGPTKLGPGLYLDPEHPEEGLGALVERLDTPWGDAVFVRGEAARQYVSFTLVADRFARRRREAYLTEILGSEGRILFNRTHQGVEHSGRMLLGCYSTRELESGWVPVTLDAHRPAYLVAPERIYDQRALSAERLYDRARANGHLDRLVHADVLPHGGGYSYPEYDGEEVVVRVERTRERSFRFGMTGEWFQHPRGLGFKYRGREVVDRVTAVGAGRVVAKLRLLGALAG